MKNLFMVLDFEEAVPAPLINGTEVNDTCHNLINRRNDINR